MLLIYIVFLYPSSTIRFSFRISLSFTSHSCVASFPLLYTILSSFSAYCPSVYFFSISSPSMSSFLTSTLGNRGAFGDMIGCDSILRGNSVLRGVMASQNSTGNHILYQFQPYVAAYLRNSENNKPFLFRSCGESFSNLQLRPIFAPNKSSLFSH